MKWKEYCKAENWHEAAKLFPLMGTQELESLARDIEKNGLQNPVLILDGKVLDGRNRLLACAKVSKEPRLQKWHENGVSALAFVIAQNLERRHITPDQKAALAAELLPRFAKEARARQKDAGKHGWKGGRGNKKKEPSAQKYAKGSGKSAARAASLFGVSTRYVEKAVALEKTRPGTLKRIKRGQITLRKADREINSKGKLADRFGAVPVTILDAKQGYWQERKKWWLSLGIEGEKGRDGNHKSCNTSFEGYASTSIFDPMLCECIYKWFAPSRGGRVLDPFAGESAKGIVAAKLKLDYTGIEIRDEQVKENQKQARKIGVSPKWICGDSARLSDYVPKGEAFDLIFTSPPYYDLEDYRGGKRDVSTHASYDEFMKSYKSIFRQAVARLKQNRFLIVKVGEIRDKKGFYRNFVGDNITCFLDLGMKYYNQAILATQLSSAPMRVGGQFPQYRKLVSTHQTILCFFKGDNAGVIPKELGVLENGQ
jgi:16S rRNA G966 N2-methylase RsmD